MKSGEGFFRMGRHCVLAAMACVLAGAGGAFAAGPGFEGRVFGVDESGKLLGTVAGATIELKGGGTTTSDGAGRYKIDVGPGSYPYKLTAAGYKDEDSGRGVQQQLSEGYAVFNFTLTKGKTDPEKKPKPQADIKTGRLKGRVYEKTPKGDLGIGGAVISLRREAGRQVTRVVTRGGGKTGEGAGRYEVGLEEGDWRASVTARGYKQLVDPKVIHVPGAGEVTRDFVLQKEEEPTDQGLDITVRVIPGDGKPVPFSDVRVGITKLPGNDLVGRETPPDGKGHLRTPLPVGRYHAYAEAEGFPTAHSRPTFVFEGRYSRIVLTLERKGRKPQPEPEGGLVVVVTDASTKRPLPGASVLARKGQQALADAARGTTGPEGETGMDVAGPGNYAVMARLDGYKPGGEKIEILPGKRHRVLIPLTPEREPMVPPTTPAPEPVPPEPGFTKAPVARTQCPAVRTECPPVVTKCPPTPTRCHMVQTQCPASETECPSVKTQCPVVPDRCPPPKFTKEPVAKTQCPIVRTQCPAVETQCPTAVTTCPLTLTRCIMIQTQCPEVTTQCPTIPDRCPPPMETRDPKAQTQCPVVPTRCPMAVTKCPPTPTRCQAVQTQCPASNTECPTARTQCPMIEGKCPPPIETRDPKARTHCPVVQTMCPVMTTRCPPTQTQCQGEKTQCPAVRTQCPSIRTQCPSSRTKCPLCPSEIAPMTPIPMTPVPTAPTRQPGARTQCPVVQTQCPRVTTKCPPCQNQGTMQFNPSRRQTIIK